MKVAPFDWPVESSPTRMGHRCSRVLGNDPRMAFRASCINRTKLTLTARRREMFPGKRNQQHPKTKAGEHGALRSEGLLTVWLELETQAELNITHLAKIAGQAGNCSSTSAIDTAVWSIQLGMVENVEKLRAELSISVLADIEPLRDRHISVEIAGAIQGVATAERLSSWTSESITGGAVGGEGSDRCKERPDWTSTAGGLQSP